MAQAANEVLAELIAAKAHSDAKQYRRKHQVMEQLLRKSPGDFYVDQESPRYPGVTHRPTGFRMHLPRRMTEQFLPAEPIDVTLAAGSPPPSIGDQAVKIAQDVSQFLGSWIPETSCWVNAETGAIHNQISSPEGFGEKIWVPICKSAEDPILSAPFKLTGLAPSAFSRVINNTSPVAGMLAGGLLGGGLGYGAGYMLDQAGMEHIGKRARTTGAILGALAGMTPAAYLGTVGHRLASEDGRSGLGSWFRSNALMGKKSSDNIKQASEAGSIVLAPSIPVDAFNRTVWTTPGLSPQLAAAATGLVQSAGMSRGSPFVSIYDIGRMAAGMGVGWSDGLLVGKTLSALVGLSPEAQNSLKSTGMMAGALKTVIPIAFGFGR